MTARAGTDGQGAPNVKCFYVDEAGDPTIFNRRGKVLVGTQGCSRFFVVGFVVAGDADALARDLESLRARLLADPYFAGVPSMRPEGGKTAVAFHAKDDLPEVRREVFALLLRHALSFTAVVRDKATLAADVKELNRWNKAYRYSPNDLYDDMVRRLFRESLHEGSEVQVCFAARGRKPRTEAFREALRRAQDDVAGKHAMRGVPPASTLPGRPAQHAGLQAADYFLWTLQRLYERGEDRFLKLLWSQCRMVVDIDDTRGDDRGIYYTQKRPLTGAALEGRLQGI